MIEHCMMLSKSREKDQVANQIHWSGKSMLSGLEAAGVGVESGTHFHHEQDLLVHGSAR